MAANKKTSGPTGVSHAIFIKGRKKKRGRSPPGHLYEGEKRKKVTGREGGVGGINRKKVGSWDLGIRKQQLW